MGPGKLTQEPAGAARGVPAGLPCLLLRVQPRPSRPVMKTGNQQGEGGEVGSGKGFSWRGRHGPESWKAEGRQLSQGQVS